MKDNIIKLIVCFLACFVAGFIGSLANARSIPTWYATLNKPSFSPPNSVFAPVWTALYIMMAIAAFLVWRRGIQTPWVTQALIAFGVQLVLNTLWSILFFGLRQPGWAFGEIVLLWIAILATIVIFSRIAPAAAWLMVPYILWVSFAAVLNFSLWRINQ